MMNTEGPLQTQAYKYIKEQILTGKLSPGTLYSQTKMAKEFGISRTPMREALQCLGQDGYIEVIPSKGFMIRSLNEKDMLETIQIRCAIEGFCVQIIAKEINTSKGQKLIEDLKKILEKQEKTLEVEDSLKTFMDYDHQFHLALVNYVDNREFNQIFQRLMYLIHLTTTTALSVPGRLEDTFKEHEKFFDSLQKGDGDLAYKLLVDHLAMPLNMAIYTD